MPTRHKKVAIICDTYVQKDNPDKLDIGGVQIYVGALVSLLEEEGLHIDIIQKSILGDYCKIISDKIRIIGFNQNNTKLLKLWFRSRLADRKLPNIKKYIKNNINKYDLVIFARFEKSIALNIPTIAIQHGIAFDGMQLSKCLMIKSIQVFREKLRKHCQPYIERNISRKVDNVICVDTNFPNYLRSAFPHEISYFSEHLHYIPNFTRITPNNWEDKWNKKNNSLIICYPRRFEIHRGIEIWIEIVKRLRKKYPELTFIFAGVGTYDKKVNELKKYGNIEIIAVDPNVIQDLYTKSHIVVIPSLFSEGTSLSALEAMASGCAVIVTSIGGLGNIISPNFNGLICQPTIESIYESVEELVQNMNHCQKLAYNAVNSTRQAFGLNIWKKRMMSVIQKTID